MIASEPFLAVIARLRHWRLGFYATAMDHLLLRTDLIQLCNDALQGS